MSCERLTFNTNWILFAFLLLFSLASNSKNAIAFDRMGSIGASLGYTQHNLELDGYEEVSTSGSTYAIIIGWDLTNRISLENSWFHLGDYEFRKLPPENNQANNVESSITGWSVAALLYLAGSHGLDGIKSRRGLNLYAKLGGASFMGDFYFGSTNIFHGVTDGERLILGLGFEYAPPQNRFALRGEVNSYDDDVVVGSLSLLWRWGRN